MEGSGPIVGLGLAEQAHGGVPGGVGTIEEPSPVGGAGEEEPGGFVHCTGQMGDGGVDRDDQIEIGDEGGGVGQIRQVGGKIQ